MVVSTLIAALRETTAENAEQGWLDSNLARIGGLLQGQRDLGDVPHLTIQEVAPPLRAHCSIAYRPTRPAW